MLKLKTALSSVLKQQKSQRICIVGAGTAGFYAAQILLKKLPDAKVDVIEKLPVPYGLVRFGVAPDHADVKNVINTFSRIAEHKNFRYFGNVSLGQDVSLRELRESYHAVLLTYGADRDRMLDIPNEQAPHVLSARSFVEWYNGMPGAADKLQPDLSGRSVAIVGQGNVAIDVARMLLTSVDVLKTTDMPDYALAALATSCIERVYLVGRRGPLQAAFTIKELRELLNLHNVTTIWRAADFEGVAAQVSGLQRARRRLGELMLSSLDEQRPEAEASGKQLRPVFMRAPKCILANELECTVTELRNDTAIPTDSTERLPADLVLRSIGYQSTCVDQDISFDERRGHVHNNDGKMYKGSSIEPGLYVAGWLGTGPTGVILNTMTGAFSVAQRLCLDIEDGTVDMSATKPGLELSRDKRVVSWSGWQRINRAEVKAGKAKGKPREKILNINEMLSIAGV